MAEPLPDASPLRELPNVILTPHQVGHTQESFDARLEAAIENIRRILAAELPLCLQPRDRDAMASPLGLPCVFRRN
jgi:phosphoglycerate dehydrogenase-like enzyme